ncbi:MAG: NUDIX hydrolase, partial [archaeon]
MYPEGTVKRKSDDLSRLGSIKSGVSVRDIVGLVVFDGEKFLLLHRVLHWKGWEFPKGGVITGESSADALKRELLEETGIPKYQLIGK